jgi:NitT/TauT family transport system permease protein
MLGKCSSWPDHSMSRQHRNRFRHTLAQALRPLGAGTAGAAHEDSQGSLRRQAEAEARVNARRSRLASPRAQCCRLFRTTYIRIANAYLPRIVLAPIFGLWFGLGIWSKVALAVTVVFFIVFFNTCRGVREVDSVMMDNARMLGASKPQLVQHVLIPSPLAWIFSSLHVSIGMAIVALVVGEYLGASRDIGYLIAQAVGVFDTTGVFAGLTILAAGVLLVGGVVSRLERWLLRWKPERERDLQQ